MTQNTTFGAENPLPGLGRVAAGISVIIPVYDEAAIIDDTVRQVRESARGSQAAQGCVEIIVCDGGAGFSTLRALTDAGVVRVESPQGRGRQMNAGAAVASGSVLLFLHADTRLPHGWPDAIGRGLADGSAGGAFRLTIDSPRAVLRAVAWFANLRSRLERVPYGDQAQFVRADVFRSLGGFPDIPIMEDVELFQAIRRQGFQVTIVPEAVTTSSRRWDANGIAAQTLTNWWLRVRHLCGASAQSLAHRYRPLGSGDRS